MNFISAARRMARSICCGRVSGNQQRWTARNARCGRSVIDSFGMMYPSVLNVLRFAMASWRRVYDAQRVPASVFAAIFTPFSLTEAAYASGSPAGFNPAEPAFTSGAFFPNHSPKWSLSHFAAAGSGHSTVTDVDASSGT